MRVLVTGGAGFIGSNLAVALRDRGDEVRILDNFLNSTPERVPEGVEFLEADLRDTEAVRKACDSVEVVFHQGAVRSVPRSIDEPGLVAECNVIGTLNLLLGAHEAGARRVVYASSSSVYGDTEAAIQQEDAVPSPLSPYAVSKLAAEHYCQVWTKTYGLSTVSLRYFNVFGPGQDPESKYSAVFPAFVSALTEGRAPEVHWDGDQTRDFSYVDDVVRANLAAAEAPESADGAVVNIGGGEPRSINQVLAAVEEAVGERIAPERTPKRPGDIRHTRADLTRAREVLGWEPEADFTEAVATTVAWFRGDR